MKGTILDYSVENDLGYISGDDGKGYTFSRSDWMYSESLPKKNLRVDFDMEGNKAIDIFVLSEVKLNSSNSNPITSNTNNKLESFLISTVDFSKKYYTSLFNKDNKLFYSFLNFIKNNRWTTATALLLLFGGYFIFTPMINQWRSSQQTLIGQGTGQETEQEQESKKQSKGRLIELSESLPSLLEDYNELVDDFKGTGATEEIKDKARSLYARADQMGKEAHSIMLDIGNIDYITENDPKQQQEVLEILKLYVNDIPSTEELDSIVSKYEGLAYEIRETAYEIQENCQKIIHRPY